MNGFISNILNRHLNPGNNIVPRLPGKFESFNANQQNSWEESSAEVSPLKTISNERLNNNVGTDDNIDTPGKETGDKSPWENNSSVSTTLFIDKTNEVNPLFSRRDTIADSFDQLPLPAKNITANDIPAKNMITDNIIFTNTENSARDVSPAIAENSIAPREKGNLPDNTPPVFVQNIMRPVPKQESTHKENPSVPGQSSLNLQQRKDPPFANRHSLFIENLQQQTPAVIKVSIGRIDVRAIVSSAAAKTEQNNSQKPVMTLDDYLKKRNGNK